MAIEGVSGLNSKNLKNVEAEKSKSSSKTRKHLAEAQEISRKRKAPPKKAEGSSLRDMVELSSKKDYSKELEDSVKKTDSVEINSSDRLKDLYEPKAKEDSNQTDSLEISWQDQEHKERIRETIELVKETKARLAERLEEARMLLMNSAYDDEAEISKTVDNMVNGEDIERLGLEEM